MKETPTKVLFRKWPSDNSIIALFPEEPSTVNPAYCSSYEHVGQHGSAECRGLIPRTEPATPTEYNDLKNELEQRGYTLQVIKRVPKNDFQIRYNRITKT